MGGAGRGVDEAEGDPNDVTVYHHFESVDVARAFMSSERLREMMNAARVQGRPMVWFTGKA